MDRSARFPEEALRWFRAWCAANAVRLAYLYGSRARGRARSDSDYDLAIRFAPEVPRGVIREAKLALAREELAPKLHVDQGRVDLHDVDAMPPALRFRVLRDGVRLWEADPQAHAEFFVPAVAEHLDHRFDEEVVLHAMRRRIREGRFGR